MQGNQEKKILLEERTERSIREPIAIVGYGVRLPGSSNSEELWNILIKGQEAIVGIPLQRQYLFEDSKEIKAGFLNDRIEYFDETFFGLSQREATCMDPQYRLLYEVTWEALEHSGINPQDLSGSNGSIFVGVWMNEYSQILKEIDNPGFLRRYLGNGFSSSVAKLSQMLGLMGPSTAIESACSSSMAAVHMACANLQLGHTDVALASGVNLLLKPFERDFGTVLLSSDYKCKTFSDDANGFVRAEGCSVLVLKRLTDAIKNGDNVLALIRGSALSQDGLTDEVGTPTVDSEERVMRNALANARVSSNQVSYVEAHGTGTSVGDRIEIKAIAAVYGSAPRSAPLIVGSVKPNIGHTESCSGIAGIIKVVLALSNEKIPAQINIKKLLPEIEALHSVIEIPQQQHVWKRTEKPRIAGVSSFGITGLNAHVIVEEPPLEMNSLNNGTSLKPRHCHIIKISAKSEYSLKDLCRQYLERIQKSPPHEKLADIAYSANIGRADFQHRAVFVGSTKSDISQLIQSEDKLESVCLSRDQLGKICFLFTGQGCQYEGMGKLLYETSSVFRENFDVCNRLVNQQYAVDLTSIFSSENKIKGTFGAHVSIFIVQYALCKLWASIGVVPNVVLGHSLGEFCAAVCCGLLSLEDGLALVAERSLLLDLHQQGKMLVVKGGEEQVSRQISKFGLSDNLEIAAVNSEEQTVVAGDSSAIDDFARFLKMQCISAVPLNSNHAFHSKQMDPLLETYKIVANKIVSVHNDSGIQYVSGLMGGQIQNVNQINPEYWVNHTRHCVNFRKAYQTTLEIGCKIFVEIGPQFVLSALILQNAGKAGIHESILSLPSLRKGICDWNCVLTTLGRLYTRGVSVNWKGIEQVGSCKKVPLPHYPFQRKRFWPEPKQSKHQKTTCHPLVGTRMFAAGKLKIFENARFTLQKAEFLKDHRIGNSIVFPGACFLEMCLRVGYEAQQNQASKYDYTKAKHGLLVTQFCITAPMELFENSSVDIQTVVEPLKRDSTDKLLLIKIFHLANHPNTGDWMLHAKAVCEPAQLSMLNSKVTTDLNLAKFKRIIEENDGSMEPSHSFYNKLAMRGLNFGKKFHSITKWISLTNELIAKVQCLDTSHKYIIHPIFLDAMIQATVRFQFDRIPAKSILVPIKIGQFSLFPRTCTKHCQNMYVRVASKIGKSTVSNTKENNSCSVSLLDTDGNVFCVMTNIEFAITTCKTIKSVLAYQKGLKPDIWEEAWYPKPISHHNSMELSELIDAIPNSKMFMQNFNSEFNYNNQAARIFRKLDQLVLSYTFAALTDCGWKLENEKSVFDKDVFFRNLSLSPEIRRQFEFLVSILEHKGITNRTTTIEGIHDALKNEQTLLELQKTFPSVHLLAKIGENLPKILRGQASALEILFPQVDACQLPSAKKFYRDYGLITNRDDVINLVYSEWLNNYKAMKLADFKPKVNCLEIGAGVGSYTLEILKTLKRNNIEFQYYYTDISSSFFNSATSTFDDFKQNLVFSKLNIEEDPVAQGYIPEYFDLIIAGDVIHSTRDLKESLLNVYILLRPGGVFHLYESVRVSRILTFIFGLLDGFWRFTDDSLRTTHCFLTTEKWMTLLNECKMPVIAKYEYGNNHKALFACVKNSSNTYLAKDGFSFQKPSKTWICFGDNSAESVYLIDRFSYLEASGRTILEVKPSEEFQNYSTNCFGARLKSESDVEFLLNKLSESSHLEGILYMWTLNDALTMQQDILQPVFYLLKALISWTGKTSRSWPKVLLFARNSIASNLKKEMHPPTSTLVGFARSYNNENPEHSCKLVDLGETGTFINAKDSLYYEIWLRDRDLEIAYVDGVRHVSKFHRCLTKDIGFELPVDCRRFQLVLPESKSIADLEFGPLNACSLGPEDVEVNVLYTALNFRDVLTVLGPSAEFELEQRFGFDFAGVITTLGRNNSSKWKIGDNVFGVNYKGTLPSHIALSGKHILEVPDQMTLAEASTLPVASLTSVLCLLRIAKITPDDTVLIHTASGGVGLCAIAICQSIGVHIICTAGSTRKRNYLRNLGIKHVFSSRNKDYSNQILTLTDHKGVTVVLNTLTGDGYKEATLQCCATNARFLEISMLSTWTPMEIASRRPDISYTLVDLTNSTSDELMLLYAKVQELIDKKIIHPLPFVQFKATNIREALWYLQKAKHIGKVVCIQPRVRMETNGEINIFTPLFSSRGTYLVTGGFGGIGWEVARWMIKMGAKHIILVGRRSPSDALLSQIKALNFEFCTNIRTAVFDVGDFSQCKEMFQEIKNDKTMPQLRGIMHCAGTVQDSTLIGHTWNTFCSTFRAKVDGTENLHLHTKAMPLEHFVLFSSGVSVVGRSGQSNHAAACYFQDAMAYHRYHLGIPAVSINWGQWTEVGIATEADIPGFRGICNNEALKILEMALISPKTQIIHIGLESSELAGKLQPNFIHKIDDCSVRCEQANMSLDQKSSKGESKLFVAEYKALPQKKSKMDFLKVRIITVLKNVLNLDDNIKLDENKDLQVFGVDSLMLLEIKNDLQELLGENIILSKSSVTTNTTVARLAKQLAKLMDGGSVNLELSEETVPSIEEIDALIEEDSILDEDIKARPDMQRVELKSIQQVMVTGCTGTLGPFVLRELSKRSTVSEIYCLLRQKEPMEDPAHDRIQSVLKERNLLDQINYGKIQIVNGDIEKTNLGMSSKTWNDLANKVDAVIHLAANIQHIKCYTRQNSIRTTNVGGLKTLLRFCVTGKKLKHIYVASALAAVPGTDPNTKLFSETWPENNKFSVLTNLAYPVSKFVGELIMKKAVLERGIPGKVFRFPFISGHAESGQFIRKMNHLMLRYIFVLQAGLLPNIPFPVPALPVDTCASISVSLFFNEMAAYDVYNIVNGNVDVDQSFAEVAYKLGYQHVKITEFSKFADELMKTNFKNSEFYLFRDLYNSDPDLLYCRLFPSFHQWQKDGRENPSYFKSPKLMSLLPEFYSGIGNKSSMEFIHQDMLYAKAKGWLPPVGWKNI